MGTAKQELAAIVDGPDWRWDHAESLQAAIGVLLSRLDHFANDVIPRNWTGDAAQGAVRVVAEMQSLWEHLHREVGVTKVEIGRANDALDRARLRGSELPSPIVPAYIRNAIDAGISAGETNVVIGGYSYVADHALNIFEGFFGNREEKAAQEVLNALNRELAGPEARLAEIARDIEDTHKVKVSGDDLREHFGSDAFDDDDTSSWRTGGGGYNYGGGDYPIPPDYNSPTPPDYGNPQPPLPHDPRIGGPYVPDPYTPGDPYPPYIPRDRDDYISIDDGSTGWQSRGLGAGVMGAAGLGGALAARSSLANSGSTTAANAAGSGQGGLLGSGAGGAGGPGGVGAGGLGAGGRSGGQMGMMGGQGGRGGGGSDKDKKPSLNGYMAPKLEDDEDEFIPLPDSARAGGRDTDQGGE